jgi:valyl-tRNA synthetase
VPLEGMIDIAKEIARLEKDLQTVEKELAKAEGKLQNEHFTAKAQPKLLTRKRPRLRNSEVGKRVY